MSVFLVQFSIALNKIKAYPPGHPTLSGAIEGLVLRLRTACRGRSALAIGVARHQLIIDGRPTDPKHPVLSELALRLHRHQLAALHLYPEIGPLELQDLVGALGTESWRNEKPLGLAPPAEFTRWPHAKLEPLGLDQLGFGEASGAAEDPRGHAAQLWLGLAAAATLDLLPEPTSDDASAPTEPDPAVIARAVASRRGDPAYDKVIVNYLLRLGGALAEGALGDSAVTRQRLAGLLQAMDAETLERLLGTGIQLDEQQALLLQAAKALPVEAVLKLLAAAAVASQQNISHGFLRILQKLASHVDVSGALFGTGAEAVLREAVGQLVTGWSLDDPNPGSYRRMLDLLARPRAGAGRAVADDELRLETHRIVQMSLEAGVSGEGLERALDEMIERGELPVVLEFLDQCASDATADAIWSRIASAGVFRELLRREPLDLRSIERLLDRLGLAGAEVMLDALEASENLTLRRRLLTRLGELGPVVGPLIVSRLPGKPWFVIRNLLLLLAAIGDWPPDFSPVPYASDPDPRVRREAYKLLLLRAGTRGEAIAATLGDDDGGTIRLGLAAAMEDCPPAALRSLLAGLDGRYQDPELRSYAIRVVGLQRSAAARKWLVTRALTRPRWFRRRRLETKSAELLAVLGALAGSWSADPEAALVLELAGSSDDPEVRAAGRPAAS